MIKLQTEMSELKKYILEKIKNKKLTGSLCSKVIAIDRINELEDVLQIPPDDN